MKPRDPQLETAVSALANALQVAAPLATRLRRDLGDRAQDALSLEAAISRAVLAMRQLRPRKGGAR